MNNNNNNNIRATFNYILVVAIVVMCIIKYIGGYNIPAIIVFAPVIAITVVDLFTLIFIVLPVLIVKMGAEHKATKKWRNNFYSPSVCGKRIYWNPETKEMEGVEPMPEYDKWKDEE